MSGWIFAAGFPALALVALHLSGRCSRLALELAATVMLAGVAGYAWQGSPDMAGQPVAAPVLKN
jgi:hypothetical protein